MNYQSIKRLQELPDLHVLAVSRASLRLVQAAYNENPLELTDEVLENAFRWGAPREVLRFLVEKKGLEEYEICELVAKIFLEAIPFLRSINNMRSTEVAVNLTELAQAFPEAISNPHSSIPHCPLSIVLFSNSFPRNLLDSMIANLPEESLFHLRDDHLLPEDESFRDNMRTYLDSHCMRAVGTIMEKVKEFTICRADLTKEEFAQLMTMLCRKTNKIEKVYINCRALEHIANAGSLEDAIAPARQMLEDSEGKCPIRTFSIRYPSGHPPPDFSVHSLLPQMKNLTCLDIESPNKVTLGLCEFLCDLVVQGGLQELNVDGRTEEEDLFLPLLDAADKSDTLTDLRLQNLHNQAEVTLYQDKILQILENNTQLEVALVCKSLVTGGVLFEYSGNLMKLHVNKACFLDGTEGDSKQRLIDYQTLLNICGRGCVKAESIRLNEFVGLIPSEQIWDKIDYLDFTGEAKQTLITLLQYGLLRQQPAVWSQKETKLAVCNDTEAPTRKRKAAGPPGGSSLQG
ncbi:expressed unknown protein [Seminavis robusta]|uniref:Uncharacterized protein n=1 Tax=Seminavis robusta TaxID=568900 RepID=A0A9N8EUL6_9STRA|nr:expressed unknown protein [Seminavis robusta]|eukprot:Sro1618_g286380.1 n/a (516) ;mRNA; r:3058-4605